MFVVWVRPTIMPKSLLVSSRLLVIARSTLVAAESSPASKHISESICKPCPLPKEGAQQTFTLRPLELLEIDLGRVRRGRDGGDQRRTHVLPPMPEDAVLAEPEPLGDGPNRQPVHECELNKVPLWVTTDAA